MALLRARVRCRCSRSLSNSGESSGCELYLDAFFVIALYRLSFFEHLSHNYR